MELNNKVIEDYYENGQIMYRHPYVDGKKHGEFKGWHSNGELKYQHFYLYDKKTKEWKGWFSNGQLRYKQKYVYDTPQGIGLRWDYNGNYIIKRNIEERKASVYTRYTPGIYSRNKNNVWRLNNGVWTFT